MPTRQYIKPTPLSYSSTDTLTERPHEVLESLAPGGSHPNTRYGLRGCLDLETLSLVYNVPATAGHRMQAVLSREDWELHAGPSANVETLADEVDHLVDWAVHETEIEPVCYRWRLPDSFVGGDSLPALSTVLQRLSAIPCPVLFCVDFDAGVGVNHRAGGALSVATGVDIRAVLLVPSTMCGRYTEIEQPLRDVLPELQTSLLSVTETPALGRAQLQVKSEALVRLIAPPTPATLQDSSLRYADDPTLSPHLPHDATPESCNGAVTIGAPIDGDRVADTSLTIPLSDRPRTVVRATPSQAVTAERTEYDVLAPHLEDVADSYHHDVPLVILDTTGAAEHYQSTLEATVTDSLDLEYWTYPTLQPFIVEQADRLHYNERLSGLLKSRLQDGPSVLLIDLTREAAPPDAYDQLLIALADTSQALQAGGVEGPHATVAIDRLATTLNQDTISWFARLLADDEAPLSLLAQVQDGAATDPRAATGPSLTTSQQRARLTDTFWPAVDELLVPGSARGRALLNRLDIPSPDSQQVAAADWLAVSMVADTPAPIALRSDRSSRRYHPIAYADPDDEAETGVANDWITPVSSPLEVPSLDSAAYESAWADIEDSDPTSIAHDVVRDKILGDPYFESDLSSTLVPAVHMDADNLPAPVWYNEVAGMLECSCGARYELSTSELMDACRCCYESFDDADRDRLRCTPIAPLKTTPTELENSAFDLEQAVVLQTILQASRGAYHPVFHFDPLTDSFTELYDDLATTLDTTTARIRDIVTELEDRLLSPTEGRAGTDTPSGPSDSVLTTYDTLHQLWNVSERAAAELQESSVKTVHFGENLGDLGEGTLHWVVVRLAGLLIYHRYAEPGWTLELYYDVDLPGSFDKDSGTIDVVLLDATDTIRVVCEIEQENKDLSDSVYQTWQKLAQIDADEHVWVFEDAEHAAKATNKLAERGVDFDNPLREGGRLSRYDVSTDAMTEVLSFSVVKREAPYPPSDPLDRGPDL